MTVDAPPGPIAPVSRPKRVARDWYDSLSDWYDLVADPFEAPARRTGLQLLDPEPGERVLDVGCGTGTALVLLARAVGETGTAVGIDLAPGMCRVSRNALADAGLDPGVVIVGDGATLPFPDDAFDALFASFVLELFDTPDLLPVLEEWRRVLDPDGRLCVVALSRRPSPVTELYERFHERFPMFVDCRPIYVRETLLEAGFRIVDGRTERVWRLPVEVVLVRPASSRS
ncbi:class I SAM-dependent methyltransferase [Natronobacterium texcoconense]|uniref:Demethylmenaquinone methyltransferase / 2-methoxy-6-polyprenyl-1,4-benzoquinol methylase n=1 Tax=Natronobacterium texcoconense TaxID=1095778 RepID=A0A1H1C124_NATTX|nr:methyltransferase domain-containing protein [Natronobacterium texcoconense]SDQ57841.1 demethylmenaquinone methyltransferase / 2-methoxy-6-polyprenyl-1,4-benzoquinol methylase [Natronobacterium texcoconense]